MENTITNTYYKYCIVPYCDSTSFKAPNKIFIRVPQNKNRRVKWIKACRRNMEDISEKNTALHVCENHFNVSINFSISLRNMLGRLDYYLKIIFPIYTKDIHSSLQTFISL